MFPVLVHLLRHLFDLGCHDMVGDDIFELVEPEEREFRKDPALVWNTLTLRGVRYGILTRKGKSSHFSG